MYIMIFRTKKNPQRNDHKLDSTRDVGTDCNTNSSNEGSAEPTLMYEFARA